MIVSRHSLPAEKQMEHAIYGWVRLTCEGSIELAHSYDREDQLDDPTE